ncbi:MAG: hypothetical protein ABIT05_14675 [Chitinophagaceae bacterium]
MKKKLLIILLFYFNLFEAISQPPRRDIIDKKIKSVTTIDFSESGEKIKEDKMYYSVSGNDSIFYRGNKPTFLFETIQKNNRILQIKKTDTEGHLIELSNYEYEEDSTCTVVTLDEGIFTRSIDKLNSRQEILLAIHKTGDTMFYESDGMGNVNKIIRAQKGIRSIEATFEYDSLGTRSKANIKTGQVQEIIIYKNNELGLPVEAKFYKVQKAGDEYLGKTTYNYEFYSP